MSNLRRNPKRDANEARIVEALRGVGCYVRPLNVADVPDLLVSHPRCGVVLLEVKSKRGRLSAGQAAEIEAIQQHGGQAVVVRSVTEALRAVGLVE